MKHFNGGFADGFVRFIATPWGSALTIAVVMQFPFALDSACLWDLRTSHLAGGGFCGRGEIFVAVVR